MTHHHSPFYTSFLFIFLGICSSAPNFLSQLNGKPAISRIAQGEDGKIQDFPYVVRLYHPKVLCSGAIISASWVLTAAHCIVEGFIYEVQAGFDDNSSTTIQTRVPIETIQHESYNGLISGYDIALIQVLPFDFSEKVSAVPLSDEMWPQGDQMYNVPCVAAGWGRLEMTGKLATRLQKLDVTARHGEEGCVCDLPFQNKRLVCISGKAGRGVCVGDSGSVLVCNKKAVGVAHVIYLEDVCNPFRMRMPDLTCKQSLSAFMYICPFLDWIREHVPDVPGTPISCNGSKISSSLVKVIVFNILLKFQATNIYLS